MKYSEKKISRKELSASEKKVISSIRSKIGKSRNCKTICNALIEDGYLRVGGGGFKIVFRKPRKKHCVKVYRDSFGWVDDSYKVPKVIEKYYLFPIYQNKSYMTQKWAKKTKGMKIKKIPDNVLNLGFDLHDDNIRIDGDRQVIIDFCCRSI